MTEEVSHCELASWRQSMENASLDLVVAVPERKPGENRKYKVISSGDVLDIYLNDVSIATWTLYDTVQDEAEWEIYSGELRISLTKVSLEPWKSALRNPMAYPLPDEASSPLLLNEHILNGILALETCSYSKFENSLQNDPDAILENVLEPESTGAFATEKVHHSGLLQEIQAIEGQIDESVENKELLERLLYYDKKILEVRSKDVTLENLLDATMFELIRHKLRSGDAVEKEYEEFANESEELQTADELFGNGLLALDREDAVKGLHLLRVAALRHNHAQSVINLVRLYMESGMEAKSLQILLQSARQSFDPLINFTTAQMFDNGVNGLQPFFALALYFYQRAASRGETTAMCFASALHLRGTCSVEGSSAVVKNAELGNKMIHEALKRGSIFAYKLCLEKHLMESNVEPHPMVQLLAKDPSFHVDYDEAKRYYALLQGTSKEMLKQIPDVEKRLDALIVPLQEAIPTSEVSEVIDLDVSGDASSPEATEPAASVVQPTLKAPSKPRSNKLQRASRGARAGMMPAVHSANRGSYGRESCERWAAYAAIAGSLYVLSFPLRVVASPWLFQTIDDFVSLFV